jgi:hypothetical protein
MTLFQDEMKPEDVFSMVTILPKKKIKVTAYLEDQDGDRVLVSEVAENLVKYIDEHMEADAAMSPVNSQLFPLCGSFMTSLVPRFVGMQAAYVLFQASIFRRALLMLSLGSTLFMQFIDQHKLKIVTETTELSDYEIESYLSRSKDFDEKINDAFNDMFTGREDTDEES